MTSRRTVLRGLGAALTLPWLPSLLWRRGAVADDAVPLRTVFFYTPNGMLQEYWLADGLADGTDTLTGLRETLSPLSTHLDRLLVIEGLTNHIADEVGGQPHSNCTGTLLTGAHVSTVGDPPLMNTISIDQVIAARIGNATRWPSLALSSEWPPNPCLYQAMCQYVKQVSWGADGKPVPIDTSPANLFEKLFGAGVSDETIAQRAFRTMRQKSILDGVQTDARSIRTKLSSLDQVRLDQYLDSVRSVETRIDATGTAACELADPAEFGTSGHLGTEDHVRLMLDLLHLALACDQTRVATYMLGVGASDRSFPWLGVQESHHELTHTQTAEGHTDKLRKIERWSVAQFAGLLDRLESTPEGEGTLLDNCQIVLCNEVGHSDTHMPIDLPLILAGGAGGRLSTGRKIGLADDHSVCDLWTSLANHHGLGLSSFGVEGSGPLDDLG